METEAPTLRRPPRQQLEVGLESGPLPAHVRLGSWPQLPWEACCCPHLAPTSCIPGGSQMTPVLGSGDQGLAGLWWAPQALPAKPSGGEAAG